MIARAAAIVLLLGHACGPVPPAEPPPIVPAKGDPTCADMCEHLRSLKCAGGAPTASGATCEDRCEHELESGFDPHVECLVSVTSCEDVDRASQGC